MNIPATAFPWQLSQTCHLMKNKVETAARLHLTPVLLLAPTQAQKLKRERWGILTTEAALHLPPELSTSRWFPLHQQSAHSVIPRMRIADKKRTEHQAPASGVAARQPKTSRSGAQTSPQSPLPPEATPLSPLSQEAVPQSLQLQQEAAPPLLHSPQPPKMQHTHNSSSADFTTSIWHVYMG